MKEDAQKRVRINLVLEAIIEAENIEVTEEEVTAEVEKMAEMYGMPVERYQASSWKRRRFS